MGDNSKQLGYHDSQEGVCVMGDSLIDDLFKMILPVNALIEEATSYIESEVKTVLQHRITEKKRIEKLLDQLLNYAGMSVKADKLFKQLCNYFFFIDPVIFSEWIVTYRDMYGNADTDADLIYNDDMDALIETKRVIGNDSMTIITGDKHGDFRRIDALCSLASTTKDDLLIILGDAGINYFGGKRETQFKQTLARLPIAMLCIHGNHERRPESLGFYQEVKWRGGVVYMQLEFPNLMFAKDGEIYDINGKKCIVIGGAYSVDKAYRIAKNIGWWADEQPSDVIKRRVEKRFDQENWHVDVVLSHTSPLKYEPREMFLDFIDDSKVDKSTEIWLDAIEDRLNYEQWFCGHYHTNKTIDRLRFLYEDFFELK